MEGDARILCTEKELTLATEGMAISQTIWADKSIIQQVFQNLISNTVRFAKTQVHLQFELADKQFALTLTNDGPPFTQEDMRRATEPYYTTSGVDGGEHFGLGLCIARMLCEKHFGRITCYNAANGNAAVKATFFCPSVPAKSND